MIMLRSLLSSRAWLAVAGLLVGSMSQATAAETLTIGSKAPAIDVEHWVQNGNGKFKPVTKFADGKVYVVEFWATWCPPCVASMPHLAQLQKKYADKAQIISISDEDLETVEAFLKGNVRDGGSEEAKEDGDKSRPQTYKQLTSAYCLTTDPDRSVYADYMDAAAQGGIPTAFIVGKDSKIEWIGHPMTMDEPLAQVVAGTWDREKFGQEFREQQLLDVVKAEISSAMDKGDAKGALRTIEKALAESKAEAVKAKLQLIRLQIQLSDQSFDEQLPDILAKAYEKYADDPQLINRIARLVAQRIAAGQIKSKEVIEATRTAAEKAAKDSQGDDKAVILDTIAHLQYLGDDLDAAIRTQTEAVKLISPQFKEQLREFLDMLKKAKEDQADDGKAAEDKKSDK
jgi:thiol-disulfide isomerase/thioredoxin